MYRASIGLLVLLAACGQESSLDTDASGDFDSAALADEPNLVRLDVLPSELLDASGDFRVLPRSFGPIEVVGGADAGTIELRAPVPLQGEVIGEFVTPIASGGTLPVVVSPVAASVTIRRVDSIQTYLTTTDERGLFSTLIVPESDYEIVIVPDDPSVPFTTQTVKIGNTPALQDMYIGLGAPVYGTVTDAFGTPLSEVEVYAVDAAGVRGASTFTDDAGWYVLYVLPSIAYDVTAAGRINGRDPLLTTSAVLVEEHGAEVDFVYTDLAPVFRGGTVLDASGKPVDDVTVRFTSKSLYGYPSEDARLTVEAATGSGGNFDVRLIAGAYQVELLPPPADDPELDHSPLLEGDLVIEGSPDLGDLVLPSFVAVSGLVVAPEAAVAEARVSCREDSFGRREWTTYSDESGAWSLLLPQVPVTCTATPPGSHRLDLASTRTLIDPATSTSVDLLLVPGVPISGRVELDGLGEAYAVVEVRDLAGTLLGSTLTETDGFFQMRISVQP